MAILSNLINTKKFDFLVLIFFLILAVIISLAIKANFLISTFLFFGLPAIWLSCRNKPVIKKVFLFSALLSIPFATIIDYIGTIDGSWFVPVSVFPFRFLDIIPIEDYIWGFMLVYLIVMYYEYFLDKGKNELIGEKMKLLAMVFLFALVLFFISLIVNPALLKVRYAYFWLGMSLIVLPAIIFLFNFPKLIFRYTKVAGYFFVLNFFHEIIGMELGQWVFPGNNFIGWVEIGEYRFPFEEFLFFIIIGSLGILSYYEFFDDDRK